ncbi:MAG TPA: hypothetical protein VNH18_08120 [Bryobacteraceae bacterium]|nr:hypothetical protein [Bryobacteraceae bacterium]
MSQDSEIIRTLAADLEADFGPNPPPTGVSEMARLVGLEGRVRAVVEKLRNHQVWKVPADSEICSSQEWLNGYDRGTKDAADLVIRALTGPEGNEPAQKEEKRLSEEEEQVK